MNGKRSKGQFRIPVGPIDETGIPGKERYLTVEIPLCAKIRNDGVVGRFMLAAIEIVTQIVIDSIDLEPCTICA